jgi:hypothetical protein
MIVEERNYTFTPADLAPFLELYGREGVQIHTRLLGNLIGYFRTEVGENLSEVVHLWGFTDMAERAARRQALWQDPEWLAFAARSPAPIRMRNRILAPTAFSPIR